jgi:hypothetical protein
MTPAVVFVIVVVLLVLIVIALIALVMVFRALGTDRSLRTLCTPTIAVRLMRVAGRRGRSHGNEEGNDTYQDGRTP